MLKKKEKEKEQEVDVVAIRLVIEDQSHAFYYANGRTESFTLNSIVGYAEGNIKKTDVD